MRNANEARSVVDAVLNVIRRELPEEEIPGTLIAGVRSAVESTLATVSQDYVTPPVLAERWGVSPDKVLNWIRNGELTAVNLASSQEGRPRYRITQEEIDAFQERRQQNKAPVTSRRRRRLPPDVIEFF